MKLRQHVLPLLGVGLSLLATTVLLAQPAHSDDTKPRKLIYLFSHDFPLDTFSSEPTPPVSTTRFWQLMDKEIKATPDLTLTESVDKADYRVELRCGGIRECSKLVVDIETPTRDVLASFNIRNGMRSGRFNRKPNLEIVAQELTQRLDERFKLLEQGGYGVTE